MSTFWAAVSAISSLVALVVVIIATTYAYRQLREASRARTASVLLQFQLWHASEPIKTFRRRLFAGEFADASKLGPAEAAQLEDVVDQMEFLSMLVEHHLLDGRAARVFYRYSPQLVWQYAKPFIVEQRLHAPGYGQYLEMLASNAVEPREAAAG